MVSDPTEFTKNVADALSAVDTYPDHCSVSGVVERGTDKTRTNFGNTGDELCAKVAVDTRR